MSKSGNTLLALVLGGAIGAAAGILYAPDSGEKTRKNLSKKAKKQQKRLAKQYQETKSNLTESAQKAKHNFEAKLNDTLSTASVKADEILVGLESKLEELRQKNAKFHAEAKIDEVKAKAKKTVA